MALRSRGPPGPLATHLLPGGLRCRPLGVASERAILARQVTVRAAAQPTARLAPVLQVRGLSVEVGGRLTLEDASFTVAPGDKVGLVGRNGAGRTSLLRVLGGEAPPAAGHVIKHGQVGYLNQDPRSGTRDAATTALTHVLSG